MYIENYMESTEIKSTRTNKWIQNSSRLQGQYVKIYFFNASKENKFNSETSSVITSINIKWYGNQLNKRYIKYIDEMQSIAKRE